MNDTGTRLFFRDYPTGSIYYLDTASPNNSHVALLGAACGGRPQALHPGRRRQHPLFKAPCSRVRTGFWRMGLYSCPVGGTPAIDL